MLKRFKLLLVLGLFAVINAKGQTLPVSGGTGNAYTLTIPGSISLVQGITVTYKANVVSASAPTININSTGAILIRKEGGATSLAANDIAAGQVVNLVYDGTYWQMMSASGNSVAAATNAWSRLGNSGTVDGTNFIGTTDNIPFSIRVNNQKAGRIDATLSNTFYGIIAGFGMSTGIANTFIGSSAGYSTTNTDHNSMFGNESGHFNNSSYNSFFGDASGYNTSTGGYNTAVGTSSGGTNTTGGFNTFIGASADATGAAFTRAVAIGYNAKVGASNSLVLGGTGADAVNVGIGLTTPTSPLYVVGNNAGASNNFTVTTITGLQTTANTGSYTGIGAFPQYNAGAGSTLTSILGGVFNPSNTSTGTITNAYGSWSRVDNSSSGTITNLYGSYIAAPTNSGTITNKYALITEANAGNVGIGTINPTQAFDVFNKFQVSSNGDIVKINNVTTSFPAAQGAASTVLTNNGSGTLSWTTPAAATVTAANNGLSLSSTTVQLGGALTANTSITQGTFTLNTSYTGTTTTGQTYNANAITTASATSITGNGITTGNVLDLSSTSTLGNGSKVLSITRSGANSTANKINYNFYSSISNTGSASTNIAGYFSSTNASNNYALIVPTGGGSVGIGTSTPTSAAVLHVAGNGNGSTQYIEDNSLTNGSILYVQSTSSSGTGSNASNGITIDRSGGNINTLHTAYGINSNVANTGATSTNVAGYFRAVGATNNYALQLGGSTSGVLNISPAANTTSYSLIMPAAQGGVNTVLANDGSGTLSWTSPTAATVTSANNGLSLSSTTVQLGGALAGATSITSTTNTGTLTVSNSGISNSSALTVSSNSTAGAGGSATNALWVTRSGANTNASHTAYGVNSTVSNTGATSTNVAGYFQATGGTNNYALQLAGSTSGVLNISPAATTTSYSVTMPSAQGAANTVLTNNGSGTLSWSTPSGTLSGGTINYIPKWTSATGLSSTSLIYDDGTSVGVGATPSGTAKLEITQTGATLQAGSFIINNASNSSIALNVASNGNGYTLFSNSSGTSGNAGYFVNSNGSNTNTALVTSTVGTGSAGTFTISNNSSISDALAATTNGANSKALNISHTGVTAGSTDYGASITSIGAGTNNIAGYFQASGATNNYALQLGGSTSGNLFISPAATTTSYSLTMPNAQGAANAHLVNDGTGSLSWTVLNAASVGAWGTTGNSGTTAGTNFIGTIDNVDVVFKRNGVNSGIINSSNTAFGAVALANVSSGTSNVAIGSSALQTMNTASGNTAVGSSALSSNVTGNANTAVGQNALNLATGAANTAVGGLAMAATTTGDNNVAMGFWAMRYNTLGTYNAAFGNYSFQNNTTANQNTAIGYGTLYTQSYNNAGATWSSDNVAIGFSALYNNQPTSTANGMSNTAVGMQALYGNTTGTNNTAVGKNAGQGSSANTTGSNNTFIGYASGLASATQRTNATAIGYNARVDASSALVLGGTGADVVNVGIGITTPTSVLHTIATGAKTANYSGNLLTNIATSSTASIIKSGLEIQSTGTWNGATATNVGLNVTSVTGGTSNYEAIFNGGGNGICIGANASTSATSKIFINGNTDAIIIKDGALSDALILDKNMVRSGYLGTDLTIAGSNNLLLQTYSGSWTTRMAILNNGNIGIGTAGPGYPLDIAATATSVAGATMGAAARYFNTTNAANTLTVGTPGGNVLVSVRATGAFWSNNTALNGGFYTSSDKRIKRVVGQSNSENDLATLMKLKVTDYMFVDSLNAGNNQVKGVIAQEVESVFPQAVSKQVNWIPNIYQLAEKTIVNEKEKTLSLTITNTNDLKVGDKVRLITPESDNLSKEVVAINGNILTLGNWNEKAEKIFVYGKEVNDFRIVDYDRLYTLSISAIQELVKRETTTKAELDDLKKQFENQLNQNQKTEQRLMQYEKENASLKSDIEKIKAQLGLEVEVKK